MGGLGSNSSQTGSPGTAFLDAATTRCCPADFSGDGFVDGFDYDAIVTCFEGVVCHPGKGADFNNDGFPGAFDYDEFVAAFETGCG